MFQIITGGSGSGKSAYAENRVLKSGVGQRIYIATMIPYGEDGELRVRRHRRLRREKSFGTIECYTGLEKLKLPFNGIVLLDCMSNLVANEMFEKNGAGEDTVEAVLRGIESVKEQVKHFFVVTNEVFSEGTSYGDETVRFMSYLGEINRRMAQMADEVTELVYGIPVTIYKAPGISDY